VGKLTGTTKKKYGKCTTRKGVRKEGKKHAESTGTKRRGHMTIALGELSSRKKKKKKERRGEVRQRQKLLKKLLKKKKITGFCVVERTSECKTQKSEKRERNNQIKGKGRVRLLDEKASTRKKKEYTDGIQQEAACKGGGGRKEGRDNLT